MTPIEFKERFIAAIPGGLPPDLSAELAEFVSFDPAQVAKLDLSEQDATLLLEAGLPRNAPPFLVFGGPKVELLAPIEGYPNLLAIGLTGFGDPIGLDQSNDNAIVMVSQNHDEPIHMNRSIAGLAHCVCGFAELKGGRNALDVQVDIALVDPEAAISGSWWMVEINSRRS